MGLYDFLALAGAMFLLAASPGPGVAATVGRALGSGFLRTLPLIAGIVLGDLVFLLLAARGLALMAEHLHLLFTAIRILGGAYLLWLAFHCFLEAWRGKPLQVKGDVSVKGLVGEFLGGLALTLGNPKVIVFYLGFLPGFMNLSSLTACDLGLTALVVALVLGTVLMVYAYAAHGSRSLLSSGRGLTGMRTVSGLSLGGAGVAVLARS